MSESTEKQFQEINNVLDELFQERLSQDAQWGEQNHPDGTGGAESAALAEQAKALCKEHAALGTVTWAHILTEEMFEAFAETDKVRLRAELVQCAAVCVAWIQKLDRDRT